MADGGASGVERLVAVVRSEGGLGRGTVRTAYALPPQTGASALAFYRGRLIPAFETTCWWRLTKDAIFSASVSTRRI